MNLDVLISTYSDKINGIELPKEKNNVKYIIVHQKYNEANTMAKKLQTRNDVEYIITDTIGLTISRNIALNASKSNLKLIADDDLVFLPNFDEVIINEYKKNKFDIGIFKIKNKDSDNEFRMYPKIAKWFNYIDCLHVCSVEMVITNNCKIKFNENFGLGKLFICGEESIFLFDAKKQKMKIRFAPYYIVSHPQESTASTASDAVIKAKGAVYKHGFGRIVSILFILNLVFFSQFSKKYNVKKTQLLISLMKGWYEA